MNRLLVVVIFFTLSVRAEGACFTIANETRLAPVGSFPAWSPDGSTIAFTADIDTDKPEIYLVTVDTRDILGLTKSFDGATNPTWSPDGQQIAFRSRGRPSRLHIIARDGSSEREVPGAPSGSSDFEPDWSPDGSRIAVVSNRLGEMGIITVDPVTGEGERWSSERELKLDQPAWSPNGTTIAAVGGGVFQEEIEGRLYLLHGPGQAELIARGVGYQWPHWIDDGRAIIYSYLRRSTFRPGVIEVDNGIECEAGPEWGGRANPIVSPDGQRVVFSGRDGEEFDGLWIADLIRSPSAVGEQSWGTLKREHVKMDGQPRPAIRIPSASKPMIVNP